MLFNLLSASYRQIIIVLITSGLFLYSTQITAQNNSIQTYNFSLKQAVEYAIQNQVSVQNAKIDEEIALKQIKEIRGVGLPQVNGSVDFNDMIVRPTQLLPGDFFGRPGTYVPLQFGTKYNATVGASASQLIFDGSYFVGLRAARTFAELSRKNTQRSKIETAQQVSKAYYSVLVNEERLQLLGANVKRVQNSYNEIKILYENGFVEKIDADRLQVLLNNLETESTNITSFVELSKYLLKFQMGLPMDANLVLTDSISNTNLQEIPSTQNFNYNERIEFSLLEMQKQLYILDKKRHQVSYLPNLVAFGSASTQAQRDEINFFNNGNWYATVVVGAKLNVPIFDGLQKSARIQTARLNMLKTENSITNLKQAIDLEISSTTTTYNNAIRSLQNQNRNLELAREILRVSEVKYKEGVGSNLEVLNAETSLKESQTNYINALYELFIAQTDLMKAKGNLY